MTQWIKCSERMPEVGKRVLAGYWATRVTPDGRFPEFQFDCAVLDYDELEYCSEWDPDNTHWMPLPEPPTD